jgi:putative membrane-bound dehydrogenase-like protein
MNLWCHILMRNLSCLFACFTGSLSLIAAEPLRFPSIDPTPPEAAASTFETLHGFKMELIAAEPLVTDPVSVTYDEDGRAYVCEMSDYPYTDKAHHKPSQENPTDQSIGKVRLLTDTNDDGIYDKATIFAADLSWPTGAACWKGGIIVVATPDIWYLKDTDNDGVADVRQKLFTGLKKLNVQAVANNPIWGLDNKIYIAGGSNGGTIQNLVHPEEPPLALRRADLRLDPVTMKMELTSGGARFGNTRDDWGNRFLCNIRNPAQHVVLDLKYLARNPYMPPVNPLHDAAEAGDQLPVHRISPPEAWRELRAKRWSEEGFKTPRSELVGSGVVTSSSGITCYRGDAYPEKFRGHLFVADVAANLFYRLVPEPDGVTFKANRSSDDGDKEFCASRDIWHRPVNFANAPDGTLTVCDMYREAIEHPWSLPDDIHAAIDLERGRDKGRLFRMAPPGFTRRKTPQLSKASTAELLQLLKHPNAWHRDTAHRLLFERQDKDAVGHLLTLAFPNPYLGRPRPGEERIAALATVESLWVLDGMGQLEEKMAANALVSPDENVKLNAIAIAERFVRNSTQKRVLGDHVNQHLGFLPSDPSRRVRFRACLAAGGGMVRADDLDDEWMRVAALCTPPERFGSVLQSSTFEFPASPGFEMYVEHAMAAFASLKLTSEMLNGIYKPFTPQQNLTADEYNKAVADEYLGIVVHSVFVHCREKPTVLEAALRGLVKGCSTSGRDLLELPTLYDVKGKLLDVIRKQAGIAADRSRSAEERVRAIALLALEKPAILYPLASSLLHPNEPDGIRLAVIQLLRQKPDKKIAPLLLDAWPTLTPAPRESAAQALASRSAWTEALLTAVEKQQIKPSEISPTVRASLQRLTNTALRDRAAKLFTASGTRAEVLAKYQASLSLKPDPTAGQLIYQAACAVCHKKGAEGRDLGPNLATVLAWTNDQLLTNILDPNREVSPNFLLYAVELNDGRILAGIVTSETSTSIALKGADGIEQNIARAEIKSLKSTGMSLMPEGLEAAITPQQMADLMAFLKK